VRACGTQSGMGRGESGYGGLAIDVDKVRQGILTAGGGIQGGISEPLGDGVFLCEIDNSGPRSSQSSLGRYRGLALPLEVPGVIVVGHLDVCA
jgi:hypothetical protein